LASGGDVDDADVGIVAVVVVAAADGGVCDLGTCHSNCYQLQLLPLPSKRPEVWIRIL